jgi:hypothetical protein
VAMPQPDPTPPATLGDRPLTTHPRNREFLPLNDFHGWYQVLTSDRDTRLPATTAAALRDLGFACNTVASVLNHAVALDRAAQVEQHQHEEGNSGADPARMSAAQQVHASTTNFVDQLTAVYTRCALTYAVRASALIDAQPTGSASVTRHEDAEPVPSQLLTEPGAVLPSPHSAAVRLDPDDAESLRRTYREVLDAADLYRTSGGALDGYDSRAIAQNRRPADVDLTVDLADALHHYAAQLLNLA